MVLHDILSVRTLEEQHCGVCDFRKALLHVWSTSCGAPEPPTFTFLFLLDPQLGCSVSLHALAALS